ncbi:hypothetical protein [Lacticaseibacillus paracasei]|uniref:hypothetical protein n=1 Tax=Lacticaseibacillus paracasei TaxID=1597 RepID=UPI00345DF326
MTSQPAKSIASMSALVTQLNMSEPKNWLLAELPAEAQAYMVLVQILLRESASCIMN